VRAAQSDSLAAGKIYYPRVPGVQGAEAHRALMVVNATDSVKRFTSGSCDAAAALSQLLCDLGSARRGFLSAAGSALLLGVAVGSELVSFLPRGWVDGVRGSGAAEGDEAGMEEATVMVQSACAR
jgi:hypothetical protein